MRFDSSSEFLASNLPVEIRDARHRLVTRATGGFQRVLPDGLYLVRATLPGGRSYENVVSVGGDEPTSLELGWNEGLPQRHYREKADEDLLQQSFPTSPGDSAAAPVELIELHGCDLEASEPGVWRIRPEAPLHDTPYAVFQTGARRVVTSLPLNPVGRRPDEAACVVAAVSFAGQDRLVTSFVRQRRVAATVEGLIRSGSLLFAADLLDQATGLLQDKYYDPAAAALGGLTLYRLGRLTDRADWVENLARDFRWLPDGQVLLAAVLAGDPDERDRGLDTLLAQTGRLMMFTDGFALLLDLLRRWPGGAGADERVAALAQIAPTVALVDWNAPCLTLYDQLNPVDAWAAEGRRLAVASRELAIAGEPVTDDS